MRAALPFKQKKFVANYILLAGNGTQAVQASGYKQTYGSLRVTACRLLTKPNVMSEIESHVQKAKLDANQVIEELSGIAQVQTPIDGNQRLKALELLGKFHKLFVDRTETVTSTDNSPVQIALARRISKISQKTGENPELVEESLQIELSDKNDEDYSAELDASVHPEVWPSGSLLDKPNTSNELVPQESSLEQ